MTIEVLRDRARKMRHTVHLRQHVFAVGEPPANGETGLTPA